MQLSLKQKALAQTIGMFALAVIVAVVITFIAANVSVYVLLNAIGLAAFVYVGYVFYSITLGELERKETLKELNKKD